MKYEQILVSQSLWFCPENNLKDNCVKSHLNPTSSVNGAKFLHFLSTLAVGEK